MKIVSYNIEQGLPLPQLRYKSILTKIKSQDADIIFLHEILEDMIPLCKEYFEEYQLTYCIYEYNNFDYQTVMFIKNTIPIKMKGITKLDDSKMGRYVLYCMVENVVYLSVHLESLAESLPTRIKQIKQIAALRDGLLGNIYRSSGVKGEYLFCGDLNIDIKSTKKDNQILKELFPREITSPDFNVTWYGRRLPNFVGNVSLLYDRTFCSQIQINKYQLIISDPIWSGEHICYGHSSDHDGLLIETVNN